MGNCCHREIYIGSWELGEEASDESQDTARFNRDNLTDGENVDAAKSRERHVKADERGRER